ncbi:MAG TPA: glucosyl-3-phosphoglycerate synthase [Balneolaceae bacterium]|nr:glucosyl-3-phosphoglycerate synthase [Balneolaceae bacterium]
MKKIDNWISKNTYHHSQFWDLEKLVEAKKEADLTISLCLPTLNEEKTIGKEVVIFQSELVERYPLLDEIAVVDSGSDDNTLEVAKNFGADVYKADDILPGIEPKQGKGENLWKAIYQLKGDIIVYVDADISNVHPRFVYGLIGPLLNRPEIQYVKAFYNRPLSISGKESASGGGRVTEILIRPLFSLFFPALTGIIQPLSGEYAVRRDVLEQIYFPVGYGVETSHLIEVYNKFGLSAFAQTDLEERVHENKPTKELGKMAFGILQTFIKRAKILNRLQLKKEFETILRQTQSGGDGYEQKEIPIVEEERPPIIEMEAYREKFGID